MWYWYTLTLQTYTSGSWQASICVTLLLLYWQQCVCVYTQWPPIFFNICFFLRSTLNSFKAWIHHQILEMFLSDFTPNKLDKVDQFCKFWDACVLVILFKACLLQAARRNKLISCYGVILRWWVLCNKEMHQDGNNVFIHHGMKGLICNISTFKHLNTARAILRTVKEKYFCLHYTFSEMIVINSIIVILGPFYATESYFLCNDSKIAYGRRMVYF